MSPTGPLNSLIAALGMLAALLSGGAALAQAPSLRAGAVALDITPPAFPVDVAGSMTPVVADYAHDPLQARCLVIDNSEQAVALVVCDSCMIPQEIFDAAKDQASRATGIPREQMLCAATHTHSAVTATPVFQSRVDAGYVQFLTERIAHGIIQAHAQREPAEIGWSLGHNPQQVFNRRWHLRPGSVLADPFDRGSDRVQMNPPAASRALLKPAGPVDPDVTLVGLRSTDGRPIALWANYALHYVGGVPSGALSADYFGEFARQMVALLEADAVDPPLVVAMTNGTSGDVNNVNFFAGAAGRQPFEQIRLVGRDLAESALVAYRRMQWHDHVTIAMRQTELQLAVRRPAAEELSQARSILAQAGTGPYTDLRSIYAHETLQLAEYPETVPVLLQALRLGDVGIAAIPCETFVETGLALKRESPIPLTFVIELANGYNGYLPTPGQHALGGYETWRAKSSYLEVDAEPKIRAALLELLTAAAR